MDAILSDPEFHLLVKESASRISNRQETDTIELIDDVCPSKCSILIADPLLLVTMVRNLTRRRRQINRENR